MPRSPPPHRTRRHRRASDRDGAVDADQRGVAGAESSQLPLRRSRLPRRTICSSPRSTRKPPGYDSNRIDGFWRATLEQVSQVFAESRASRWPERCRWRPAASDNPGRTRPPARRSRSTPTSSDRRYFQTLGIPRAARARIHRGRWKNLAAGRDRQRASRRDVLAAAGSDWQGSSCARVREPDRGSRRSRARREIPGPPRRSRPDVLPPGSADTLDGCDDLARSRVGRSRRARERPPARDPERRPQRSAVSDHDSGGTTRRVVRPDAPGGAADRRLRRARAPAQRHRRLRSDCARGEPADSRYRHSHGAWRPARDILRTIGVRGVTLVAASVLPLDCSVRSVSRK